MKHFFLIFLSIFAGVNYTLSQQTVGLFSNTLDSYNGYTLFSPISSTSTYLIDNCGERVHSWGSTYSPGLSAYILEDGDLLRIGQIGNTTFTAGGNGGIIELLDWDGTLIWDYTISTATECQHHDIAYLPNGNILAIVWDSKTSAEASSVGRNVSGQFLWSEKIIEIQPDLVNGGGVIVWEWYAWDHLVQDVDNTKPNFGDVSASPELININFVGGNANNSDWLHINAIDYNASLDQIVLSNHNFSEVWIIDHSTTTAEASTHAGGNSNKGGDLLYRWGNPQAYNQGTSVDQQLFKQHDSYWIPDALTDGGMIMVFNNKAGGNSNYSTVNVISPPLDLSGYYNYVGGAYAPSNFHWTYQSTPASDFYSSNISGARRLPNDNTLICEGRNGRFFEVDYSGNIVWEYISPINGGVAVVQNTTVNQNAVFRAERYAPDYVGFDGETLTPQGYIESGSTFSCDILANIGSENQNFGFAMYPNPTNGYFIIDFYDSQLIDDNVNIEIFNLLGEQIIQFELKFKKSISVDFNGQNPGVYFCVITAENGVSVTKKIVLSEK